MIHMASVDQAQALLREHGAQRLQPAESVRLADALGRHLAAPALARTDQPPADVSAMDGYAVRRAEAAPGAALQVIGESRAGHPHAGDLPPGCAVRIFTGAIVPPGADHILIQEDARRESDRVEATAPQTGGASIRRQGRDFCRGAELAPVGQRLTPGAIALLAAGNIGWVSVRRRPRVAILANGDELVEAGGELGVGQIVNSISPALTALASQWGAAAVFLGISRDEIADVQKRIAAADADLILSIGGASVGDHDVVRSAFAQAGFSPVFEKVAVKPGKPTWFSERGPQLALGLPGNPAAAMVTARLFLQPLLEAMLGLQAPKESPLPHAHLSASLPETGNREEYLRAVLSIDSDGRAHIAPAEDQDSSLLHPFLRANALIRKKAGSLAIGIGERVEYLPLSHVI